MHRLTKKIKSIILPCEKYYYQKLVFKRKIKYVGESKKNFGERINQEIFKKDHFLRIFNVNKSFPQKSLDNYRGIENFSKKIFLMNLKAIHQEPTIFQEIY